MCDSSSSDSCEHHHSSKHWKKDKCNKGSKVRGNLKVGKRLILKDPVTIHVPSTCYPTIQSAIDYFNGRHAMNGTIIVAPGGGSGPNGAYKESVIVNKMVSNRDNFRG